MPAGLWGCVHLFTDAVQCFFPSKLCTSLSIPSKMLDAKSPQGMCQRLLNTLYTLINFTWLWFHCWGNANGSTWHCPVGKQGKLHILVMQDSFFPTFIDFFAFSCCMDSFFATSYLPKALLYRQEFFHRTQKSLNSKNNER